MPAALFLATTVQTIPDPDTVSPGFAGFVAIFLLAVATLLLVRSMVKHLRNVRYLPNDLPDDQADEPTGRKADSTS